MKFSLTNWIMATIYYIFIYILLSTLWIALEYIVDGYVLEQTSDTIICAFISAKSALKLTEEKYPLLVKKE